MEPYFSRYAVLPQSDMRHKSKRRLQVSLFLLLQDALVSLQLIDTTAEEIASLL